LQNFSILLNYCGLVEKGDMCHFEILILLKIEWLVLAM